MGFLPNLYNLLIHQLLHYSSISSSIPILQFLQSISITDVLFPPVTSAISHISIHGDDMVYCSFLYFIPAFCNIMRFATYINASVHLPAPTLGKLLVHMISGSKVSVRKADELSLAKRSSASVRSMPKFVDDIRNTIIDEDVNSTLCSVRMPRN